MKVEVDLIAAADVLDLFDAQKRLKLAGAISRRDGPLTGLRWYVSLTSNIVLHMVFVWPYKIRTSQRITEHPLKILKKSTEPYTGDIWAPRPN